jgi:16S rRNA (guanine966-N2)-methyltransferase
MLGCVRVIAGSLRSRSLQAPPGLATRPTSDRLRETLFNVLAPRIEGAAFLDLYAGSGAVGIEAMSRAAANVVFVEKNEPALKVLRANLVRLDLKPRAGVFAMAASMYLKLPLVKPAFNIVFLDPPYDATEEYEKILGALGGAAHGLLKPDALVIAEHRRKDKLSEAYGMLRRKRLLRQGDASLSFYAIQKDEPATPDEDS